MKKNKPKSKAYFRRKADKLFQQIGRTLYKDCLICGGEYSCLHHYHPRSTCSALRYNLKNGINICASCHLRLHSSGDPTFNEKILERKGKEWADELQAIKRNTFIKPSIGYYKGVISNLEKFIIK